MYAVQGLGEDIEKALEEVFNLDFEDIVACRLHFLCGICLPFLTHMLTPKKKKQIGDQPVRFKYRQVQPLDYGLSTREVLALEDRQLNEILPLKYLAPLRRQSPLPLFSSYSPFIFFSDESVLVFYISPCRYRSDQRVPRPKMKKLELYRQELRNKS